MTHPFPAPASAWITRLYRLLRKRISWVAIDAFVVAVSLALSWSARSITSDLDWKPAIFFCFIAMVVYCGVNYLFRFYHRIWRYASAGEVVVISCSIATSTIGLTVADLMLPEPRPVPVSVAIFTGVFAMVGFVGVRYRRRMWTGFLWRWRALLGRVPQSLTRVLIVGAGESGQLLGWRFLNQKEGEHYKLVGFVDDDPSKHGMRIHGIRILGDRNAIPSLVSRLQVDIIVIAMHQISGADFRSILDICESSPAVIKVIPNVFDLIRGGNGHPAIRDVTLEDMLGRTPVEIDYDSCRYLLAGKTVLVTGAAGSIGSELCRQILGFGPEHLLMLDNNETGLYELRAGLEISNPEHSSRTLSQVTRVTTIVADVTNEPKMRAVFARYLPQVVFHAAAYKHVPLMEDHPDEAVRVNVLGTRVVASAAASTGAERFVLVSTDKAVKPTSVMGATKRVGEVLTVECIQEHVRAQTRSSASIISEATRFTAVRFGNVLGSRGSVVPLFERQIDRGGPVTVTHEDMTRYLMSIPEAVSLIIQAATITCGGDIFMLDMGQRIRIDDLARRLIRLRGLRPEKDIRIVYTGPRPGEKMHEELLGPGEERIPTAYSQICRIQCAGAPNRFAALEEIDELVGLVEGQEEEMLAKLWRIVSLADERSSQTPGQVFRAMGSPAASTSVLV